MSASYITRIDTIQNPIQLSLLGSTFKTYIDLLKTTENHRMRIILGKEPVKYVFF